MPEVERTCPRGHSVASLLVWVSAAQGQSTEPGSVTTEKGRPVAPAEVPQPALRPSRIQADPPSGSDATETNGPGSAGTSSNPLVHQPGAIVPQSAKNSVVPENGVYSATEDKSQPRE